MLHLEVYRECCSKNVDISALLDIEDFDSPSLIIAIIVVYTAVTDKVSVFINTISSDYYHLFL